MIGMLLAGRRYYVTYLLTCLWLLMHRQECRLQHRKCKS